MCGIAGYFTSSINAGERMALLRRMCDSITHRGPDDAGYYTDEQVGLSMRRLSIIDLAGGHQPISSEDKNKQIVFNGEIYNFASLRLTLEQKGHSFVTDTDTEVILHQYEEDGSDCVHQLNGMFAFAIWDKSARTLFLARDRMGIKPLYYYWDNESFYFASEIKAILASGRVKKALNLEAMWDYLTFRYVPQPNTIWTNIYKLPPGHTLTISVNKPYPHVQRYWDIPYNQLGPSKSEAEYDKEFEQLFLDATRLHLRADVPVGILLSGGLDSSAVAAAVAEVHNVNVSSFSVAFKDSPAINELPFARQVAGRVGTDHHEIVIGDQEFCDFLPSFVRFTDEPLADLASVPLYYVSHLARKHVKVVLSGEGSDEVLGGYSFNKAVKRWDMVRQFQRLPHWLRETLLVRMVNMMFGGQSADRVRKANIPVSQFHALYPPNMTNYLDSDQKQMLFKGNVTFKDSMGLVRTDLEHANTSDPLHQLLYIYCQSWLVEDLLMKADKMTMANSIELRVPFLDYRLVEWAARTPSWVKVGRNGYGQYQTKRVLRHFAHKRLPQDIITRPKWGFPVPVYDWLNNGLQLWATDLLSSANTQVYRWLEPSQVRQYLHLGCKPDSTMMQKHHLWNLLILELWAQEWQP